MMIVKYVRKVTWSIGMGRPSLTDEINRCIDRESGQGVACIGIERNTEFEWLVLFGSP